MNAALWHRVIIEAERLLGVIQDRDGSAEVLEANVPASWNVIAEAADTLEDALASAGAVDDMESCGLSRRDEFAARAMQGFISAQTEPFEMWPSPDRTAKYAVEYADALMAALGES